MALTSARESYSEEGLIDATHTEQQKNIDDGIRAVLFILEKLQEEHPIELGELLEQLKSNKNTSQKKNFSC